MATNMFNMEQVYNEETLRYWLFPHQDNGEPVICEDELECLCAEYLAYLSEYTQPYIWNNEPFSISVKMAAISDGISGDLGPHLSGSLVFGDYTDDEWFIVYLVMKLTQEYKGLVCRMVDNDGEFILIEAADHLPNWVDPETAQQRVYLRGGKVHLIPLALSPSTLTPHPHGIPHVMDAVATVNTLPASTMASNSIQDAIAFKIEEFPGKIGKDQHIAHAYVPVGVAALLREYPTLVASAVRAFCRRDQKDNKSLRVMRHFPPEMRVLTSVRFSKALYAQICAHQYTPDVRTGWGSLPQSDKVKQAHLLGIKLACGFEILVCSAGGVTPSTPSGNAGESSECDKLDTNPKWSKYKESLHKKGYFRGEFEGSKLYKELDTNARQYFVSNVVAGNLAEECDEMVIGSMVVKLLNKVNADYDFFKEREARLVPPDDESWLEINPKSFDQMLSSKFTPNGTKSANDTEIIDSLNKFMAHVSDIDGAEIPPELQDTLRKSSTDRKTSFVPKKHSRNLSVSGVGVDGRKLSMGRLNSSGRKLSFMDNPQYRKVSSQSTGSNASDMSSFSTKIDMNSDAFTDAAHNMLDLSLPEDEYWAHSDSDDSSGMSSYGGDSSEQQLQNELLLEDDTDVSRKTSNGSQDSGVTNNSTDPDLIACMEQIQDELKNTNIAEILNCTRQKQGKSTHKKKKSGKKIPLVNMEDEFECEEHGKKSTGGLDSVDMHAVRNIVAGYKEEGGMGGPATTILRSLTTMDKPSK